MKNIYRCLYVISIMFVSHATMAVTLIELKQGDGTVDRMYFQGMKVRVDSSRESGYVIIDVQNNRVVAVSHDEKKIIDMGGVEDEDAGTQQQSLDVQFVNKGKGPNIAGYSTQHVEVRVNGKKCADEYLNKKLPQQLGIEKVLNKMPAGDSGMEMMEDMGMEVDPCMMAEPEVSRMYSRYGYPLRSVRANGELDTEVVRIDKKASMPSGGFGLPKGYQRVDAAKMMQDFEKKMQNMPELTPEGMQNMTPEQLQQMQQMMEQVMKKIGQPGQ